MPLLQIAQPRMDQVGVHRITCATDTPGTRACVQISSFSSSEQNRRF